MTQPGLDQDGIAILAHMRDLTTRRIASLEASLFHLEDSLPILVAEFERMISEHRSALQYEQDVLRRQDAHMQGALFALPGQVGLQTQTPVPAQPLRPSNNLEAIHAGQPQPQPGQPLQMVQGLPPGYVIPQPAPQHAQPLVPHVGMTSEPAMTAQARVGASSAKYGDQIRAAVPLPQSAVKAVMYEPGESRPPESLPGHMDPNGPEPRSAEELLVARDAERNSRVAEPAAAPVEPSAQG